MADVHFGIAICTNWERKEGDTSLSESLTEAIASCRHENSVAAEWGLSAHVSKTNEKREKKVPESDKLDAHGKRHHEAMLDSFRNHVSLVCLPLFDWTKDVPMAEKLDTIIFHLRNAENVFTCTKMKVT